MEAEGYELDLECEIPLCDEEYWRSVLEDLYEHEETPDYAWVLEGEELIEQREIRCQSSR